MEEQTLLQRNLLAKGHTGFLRPTQLPSTLRGTLIVNQIATTMSIVRNGTAPLDPLIQTKKFRVKNILNAMPGISRGV